MSIAVLELPGARRAKRSCRLHDTTESLPVDVAATLVTQYTQLGDSLTSPYSSPERKEFAYGRLLGVRGGLCRLCPVQLTHVLPARVRDDWEAAELRLRTFFSEGRNLDEVAEIAHRVEGQWSESAERYIQVMASYLSTAGISDQMGLLKGIDTIALHLAQREVLGISEAIAVPSENAYCLKLGMRLVALFLTLHRFRFHLAVPAIKSYRDTFRIVDAHIYPWWFVDCRLTDKQLNWTYRRLTITDLDWRY